MLPTNYFWEQCSDINKYSKLVEKNSPADQANRCGNDAAAIYQYLGKRENSQSGRGRRHKVKRNLCVGALRGMLHILYLPLLIALEPQLRQDY